MMSYMNKIIRSLSFFLLFVSFAVNAINANAAHAGGGKLPQLAVTKTCPATAKPGEVITCEVKVANTTKYDYWWVMVNEVVPPNLTFINQGLPAGCTIEHNRPVCKTSPLSKHSAKTYSFKFKVSENAACNSVITNQVDVSAKLAQTNWAKASITVKCDDNDKKECVDGKDNDGDGWIDNDDSCCIKTNGVSETCNTDKPQCSDGKDNDGDGWIDNDDSCCIKTNGASETCNTDKPQCSDGKDNDGDGWIDLDDSGCTGPDDNDETNLNNNPSFDFQFTGPETTSPGDTVKYRIKVTNTSAVTLNQINSGIHFPNNDGFTFLPAESSAQCSQYTVDGIVVFGCGLVNIQPGEMVSYDFAFKVQANRTCSTQVMVQADVKGKNVVSQWKKIITKIECVIKQCSDGKDNDGDGWIDNDDSCCIQTNGQSETCTPPTTQCNDGKDNDGDGWIDLDDSCCRSAAGDSEDSCNVIPKKSVKVVKTGPEWINPGQVATYVVTITNTGNVAIEANIGDKLISGGEGSSYVADQSSAECTYSEATKYATCRKATLQPGESKSYNISFRIALTAVCNSQIMDQADVAIVGGNSVDWSKFITKVQCIDKPECSDGKDNDGDGWIDNDDSCCIKTNGTSETCTPDKPQCSDGKDNDGDGWIDLDDSGCDGPNDDDETDKPQCKDGKDNDGDGKVDFPADPGCDSPTDNDEKDKPQCSDGKDNDGDGKIDFPKDPGCENPEDDDEWNATTSPILPISECVYDLGNGKYRAYFGYENTGSEALTIPAGIQSNGQMNIFTPGEAKRGQPDLFELGRKKAVFSVNFDGSALTWKVQPTGGDLKTVTVSKSTQACKPVLPIAECRDKKQGNKFLTFFGYQNDNQFEIKLTIPEENKFVPAPEDRAQPKTFFNGRVVNAFSVTSDSDLTWKLATASTFTTSQLPACSPNSAPKCGALVPNVASCQGDQTRVPLSGSQATDPDNDPLTYKWSTDCAGATISDPTAANPDLVVDTSDGKAKNCGVWLVVSDGVNEPATCDQTVKITACDKDCAGQSNGAAKPDLCGVCNGSNACVDCNGVPNGGAQVDSCGVCGGNNSCTDCAGNPNGAATLDQCGVCNGDGKSCLDCTSTDLNDKKLTLDIGVNQQRLLVIKISARLRSASNGDKKFDKIINESLNQAELLYQEAWKTVWTELPAATVNCTNSQVCQESDLSAALVSYDTDSLDLRDISLNLLRQIQSLRGKNDKKAKQNDKKYAQQANQLYQANAAVLATVPRFTSQCQ